MRRRREALSRSGSRRSAGVIDWMIASTRLQLAAVDGRLGLLGRAADARDHLDQAAQRAHLLELLHLLQEVLEREGVLAAASRPSPRPASASTFSWARSTSVSTSPMPRIRPARRSGWNASSASVFSPVPRNLTGTPVTALIDSAAPPRASPSILVRTRPVSGDRVAECLGDRHRLLADHRVHDQQRLGRLDGRGQVADLGHQRLVDRQPAGGVEDDRVAAGCAAPRRCRRARCRARWCRWRRGRPARRVACPASASWSDGGRTVRIGGDQQRPAALLGRLSARAWPTTSSCPSPAGRRAATTAGEPDQAEGPVARAEDRGQLLVDDLDDLLAGVEALEHLGADCARADARHEVLDDAEVDVRLEQRQPDLAHCGVDVGFGDTAAAGQLAERIAQSVG